MDIKEAVKEYLRENGCDEGIDGECIKPYKQEVEEIKVYIASTNDEDFSYGQEGASPEEACENYYKKTGYSVVWAGRNVKYMPVSEDNDTEYAEILIDRMGDNVYNELRDFGEDAFMNVADEDMEELSSEINKVLTRFAEKYKNTWGYLVENVKRYKRLENGEWKEVKTEVE